MKQLIERGAVSQDETGSHNVIGGKTAGSPESRGSCPERLYDQSAVSPETLGTAQTLASAQEFRPVSAITTLDDLSVLNLTFELPENLLGSIQPGQNITARSDAWPGDSFSGHIGRPLIPALTQNSLTFRARVVFT